MIFYILQNTIPKFKFKTVSIIRLIIAGESHIQCHDEFTYLERQYIIDTDLKSMISDGDSGQTKSRQGSKVPDARCCSRCAANTASKSTPACDAHLSR